MNQITWNKNYFSINSKKISSNYNTIISFRNKINGDYYNGFVVIIQNGIYYDFFVNQKIYKKLNYLDNLIFVSTNSKPNEILIKLFGFNFYELFGCSEFNSLEIIDKFIKIHLHLKIKRIPDDIKDIFSICYFKTFYNSFEEIKFY